MREILFRGKKLNGGEWIEGSLIKFSEDKYEIHVPFDPNKEITIENTLEKVEPESIGQYTGLQDKNGVRIFEGDVLLSVDEELGNMYAEVVFEKGAFLIKEPGYDAELFLGEELGDFEIVGNVFENKELLEVE